MLGIPELYKRIEHLESEKGDLCREVLELTRRLNRYDQLEKCRSGKHEWITGGTNEKPFIRCRHCSIPYGSAKDGEK